MQLADVTFFGYPLPAFDLAYPIVAFFAGVPVGYLAAGIYQRWRERRQRP